MRMLMCLAVLGAVLSPAQAQTAAKAKPKPITEIVFDDEWNVDFVKRGCEYSEALAKDGNPNAKPCILPHKPSEIVFFFEDKIETAFVAEPVCHGLTLLHSGSQVKTSSRSPSERHWSLSLWLTARDENHAGDSWTIANPPLPASEHQFRVGTISTPQRLVQDVCRIVKGVGGKLE